MNESKKVEIEEHGSELKKNVTRIIVYSILFIIVSSVWYAIGSKVKEEKLAIEKAEHEEMLREMQEKKYYNCKDNNCSQYEKKII